MAPSHSAASQRRKVTSASHQPTVSGFLVEPSVSTGTNDAEHLCETLYYSEPVSLVYQLPVLPSCRVVVWNLAMQTMNSKFPQSHPSRFKTRVPLAPWPLASKISRLQFRAKSFRSLWNC